VARGCTRRGPKTRRTAFGQTSNTEAAALLDDLPKAQWLLGDRGYDDDWFRDALQAKGMQACIPGRKSRYTPVRYDKRRYRRRSRIEIMFGHLKDWRRVATRYDRCPTVFFRHRPRSHRPILAMTNES